MINPFTEVKGYLIRNRIEKGVAIERSLAVLREQSIRNKLAYDEDKTLHLDRLRTINERSSISKGGVDELGFIKDRILDKLSNLEKSYTNETLSMLGVATSMKKELDSLYKDIAIKKAVEDELNRDRIGSAYETVLEAYQQKKIDKEKFKEIRKNTEDRLGKQVHYSDMIVRDVMGRILLLKRADNDDDVMSGQWGLPGGHVDPGEDHKEAAIRELNEESAVEVKEAGVYHVGELTNSKAYIQYYEAYVDYIPVICINTREHSDYEWVSVYDLNKYNLIGDLSDILKKIFGAELDPKVVEVRKAFNTILTAYYNDKLDEKVVVDTYAIYLEKAEKTAPEKQKKVKIALDEFKAGKLKSGSGDKVTDRKQAIAIALSEAGLSKATEVKVSKKGAEYVSNYYEEGKQCKDCVHYEGGKCSKVAGEIDANGHSKYFEAKEKDSIEKSVNTIIKALEGGQIKYDDLSKSTAHKYIKRSWKDGKWEYTYDEPKKLEDNFDVELKKVKDYATRVIEGKGHIERLSPAEERGCINGGRRNVEATILLSTVQGSDPTKRGDVEREGEEQETIKKSLEGLEFEYRQKEIELDKLEKSFSHKYIRKEPDGRGGWNYVYSEEHGEHIDKYSQKHLQEIDKLKKEKYKAEVEYYYNIALLEARNLKNQIITPTIEWEESAVKNGFMKEEDRKSGKPLYDRDNHAFSNLESFEKRNFEWGLKWIKDRVNDLKDDLKKEDFDAIKKEVDSTVKEFVKWRLEKIKLMSLNDQRYYGYEEINKALEILELAYEQGKITLDVLEKARTGVYADTSENRKLKRVGQKYGIKGQQEQGGSKQNNVVDGDAKKEKKEVKEIPIEEHAKTASGSALETAAKEASDPEVRAAAHQELDRRSKEEAVQEEKDMKQSEKKEEERDNVVDITDKDYWDRSWDNKARESIKQSQEELKRYNEIKSGLTELFHKNPEGTLIAIKKWLSSNKNSEDKGKEKALLDFLLKQKLDKISDDIFSNSTKEKGKIKLNLKEMQEYEQKFNKKKDEDKKVEKSLQNDLQPNKYGR
jgi:8-oxo-dGTP pyrophosphatase MutT (NUDIX family)